MNPDLPSVQMSGWMTDWWSLTKVPDDLPDHVFEHPCAVLGVEEGQELQLVEQLVSWVDVGLEPAVLQALQHLLGCVHKVLQQCYRTTHFGGAENTFSPLTFLVQFQIFVIFDLLCNLFLIQAFAGQKLDPVFIPSHVTCGTSATRAIQVPVNRLSVHLGATGDQNGPSAVLFLSPSPSGSTARKLFLFSIMASWKCSSVFSMIQRCISLALTLWSLLKSTLNIWERRRTLKLA